MCLRDIPAASDQQNSLLDSVADTMNVAGLSTSTLNYTMYRYVRNLGFLQYTWISKKLNILIIRNIFIYEVLAS